MLVIWLSRVTSFLAMSPVPSGEWGSWPSSGGQQVRSGGHVEADAGDGAGSAHLREETSRASVSLVTFPGLL